jgi:hypothetical protein
MTPSIVLEYIMFLCSRSKLQARLGLYVEAAKDFPQWSTLESTLTLVVNGLGSLPSMQGASMVTFVWVTSSIIVASTVLALLYTPSSSISSRDEESQSESSKSSNSNMDLFHN